MRRFWLALACVAALTGSAGADGITMTVIGGTCVTLQLKGAPAPCAPDAKVVYTHLPNGITLFNVPLSDDRVFGFIGQRDAQPKPEQYVLYLERIRVSKGDDQSAPTTVTGTCKADLSTDGTIMSRIVCDAADKDGAKYVLDFKGDGKPVDLQHF